MVKTPPSNAGGAGLIPGWGTKIPHARQCGQKYIYINNILLGVSIGNGVTFTFFFTFLCDLNFLHDNHYH